MTLGKGSWWFPETEVTRKQGVFGQGVKISVKSISSVDLTFINMHVVNAILYTWNY
jgi:hypothetical protein